jgi:hypothetical protein
MLRYARLISFAFFAVSVVAQDASDLESMGMDTFGGGKKIQFNKRELPFIRCAVCEHAVAQMLELASSSVEGRKADGAKGTGIRKASYSAFNEQALQDLVEKVCDVEADEGKWLSQVDAVQTIEGGVRLLTLERMAAGDNVGKCGVECATAGRACEDLMADHDVDIVEMIWVTPLPLSPFPSILLRFPPALLSPAHIYAHPHTHTLTHTESQKQERDR